MNIQDLIWGLMFLLIFVPIIIGPVILAIVDLFRVVH